MEYNQKVMANGKATNEQKLEAEAAYYEAKKRLADDKNVQSVKQENDYYNKLVATEKQRYIDGKVGQKTFEDALELMELEHLSRREEICCSSKMNIKNKETCQRSQATAGKSLFYLKSVVRTCLDWVYPKSLGHA